MSQKDETEKDLNWGTREVDHLLSSVKKSEIELSPFLVPRVLAEIESRRKAKEGRSANLWKRWFIIVGPVLALALIAVIVLPKRPYEAAVGQEMVVLLEGTGTDRKQVAHVKVELPEGVHFYAEGMPELENQASITMPWAAADREHPVPVVIRSSVEGLKAVKVHYLDPQDREVSTGTVRIRFKKPKEQRI